MHSVTPYVQLYTYMDCMHGPSMHACTSAYSPPRASDEYGTLTQLYIATPILIWNIPIHVRDVPCILVYRAPHTRNGMPYIKANVHCCMDMQILFMTVRAYMHSYMPCIHASLHAGIIQLFRNYNIICCKLQLLYCYSSHTRTGCPIRVRDVPYAYGINLCYFYPGMLGDLYAV